MTDGPSDEEVKEIMASAQRIKDAQAAAWKEKQEKKAIPLGAAEEFMDTWGKTGMLLLCWDDDEAKDVAIQFVTIGKTVADRRLANALYRALRYQGLV